MLRVIFKIKSLLFLFFGILNIWLMVNVCIYFDFFRDLYNLVFKNVIECEIYDYS